MADDDDDDSDRVIPWTALASSQSKTKKQKYTRLNKNFAEPNQTSLPAVWVE